MQMPCSIFVGISHQCCLEDISALESFSGQLFLLITKDHNCRRNTVLFYTNLGIASWIPVHNNSPIPMDAAVGPRYVTSTTPCITRTFFIITVVYCRITLVPRLGVSRSRRVWGEGWVGLR